ARRVFSPVVRLTRTTLLVVPGQIVPASGELMHFLPPPLPAAATYSPLLVSSRPRGLLRLSATTVGGCGPADRAPAAPSAAVAARIAPAPAIAAPRARFGGLDKMVPFVARVRLLRGRHGYGRR